MVNVDNIKRKLLIKYPSFGSVLANMNYVETIKCPIAETDGDTIYYNPDFISGLTEDEKVFIFAHEIAHVALNHIYRSEGKDKRLWNTAADAVINANLVHDGLPLVEGGVNKPEAYNYDVESYYEKLLKEKENNNQNQKDNKNSQSSSDGNGQENNPSQSSSSDDTFEDMNVGHDSHSMWDDAIEKRKNQDQQNSNGNGQKQEEKKENKKKSNFLDKLFNRDKNEETKEEKTEPQNEQGDTEPKSKKEETIKKLSEQGEKKTFSENKKEKEKLLEELKNSLAKQSTSSGNTTDSNIIKFDDIGNASPLIDWRRYLREAIKLNVDWSYKNATVEDGIVTPHLEKMPQPETEILLDTSGSINNTLLRNFLRECKNILKTSKVKVGCFDTKFYGFHEIRNEKDIDNMEFVGRGGTNFDTAVNAFSRRTENKIIFTDGYADMPEKSVNAIWVVFGSDKINPPGGKVIYITDEQLKKLSNSNSNNCRKR